MLLGHGEMQPVRISLNGNDEIFDVIKEGLKEYHLAVTTGLVKVKFQGAEVRPGAPVRDYLGTTDSNPLLLQLKEGKLHAVIYITLQVVCGPCVLLW